jgi:hypothetical protein
MKWPDAAERGEADSPTEYRPRIKSSAFFRDPDFTNAFLTAFEHGFPLPGRCETPIMTALCPLSVHPAGKLMQKIHRLTDN